MQKLSKGISKFNDLLFNYKHANIFERTHQSPLKAPLIPLDASDHKRNLSSYNA